MSENGDSAIKLFGQTIPLPPSSKAPELQAIGADEDKDLGNKEASPESVDMDQEPHESEQDEPSTPSSNTDQQVANTTDLKGEESKNEINNSPEKAPKKPDKIIPCPRCNSVETKFCYFNNYNLNQPRHFCKNCQRYWTAGGSMRNVPVGAGRRKNKNSAPYYSHQTMPDARIMQSINHLQSKANPNGTLLDFGSRVPVSESMTSVMFLAEKTKNSHCNRFHQEEKAIPFSYGVQNGDENSSSSSVMTPDCHAEPRGDRQEQKMQYSHRIPAPIPCFSASPWLYPWNPAPGFGASSFSIPLYPATSYWGCTVPGNWNIPWLSHVPSPSPRSDFSLPGPNSPSLGKHSRKEEDEEQKKEERRLWVPKTLKIDNPEEAAKSSIWGMMGTKNDRTAEASSRRLFETFQPMAEMKDHRTEASEEMCVNPAALSRSRSFHESA